MTRLDLPLPETPVTTVNVPNFIVTFTFFKLFWLARIILILLPFPLRLFPRSSSVFFCRLHLSTLYTVLHVSSALACFHFLTSSFYSSHFASFLPKRCNALHFGSIPDLQATLAAPFFRLFLTSFDRFRHCFSPALRSSGRIRLCKGFSAPPSLHLFAVFFPKSGAKKEDVKTC